MLKTKRLNNAAVVGEVMSRAEPQSSARHSAIAFRCNAIKLRNPTDLSDYMSNKIESRGFVSIS